MAKLPRLKLDDPVEVTWLDVVQDPAWQSVDAAAAAQPVLCSSLGYYLNHTRTVLRISESVNRDMGQRSVQVLPMGLVVGVRKLG